MLKWHPFYFFYAFGSEQQRIVFNFARCCPVGFSFPLSHLATMLTVTLASFARSICFIFFALRARCSSSLNSSVGTSSGGISSSCFNEGRVSLSRAFRTRYSQGVSVPFARQWASILLLSAVVMSRVCPDHASSFSSSHASSNDHKSFSVIIFLLISLF